MAIGWITALKLVPWGEVIEAAPQVIKAAKALIRKKDAQQSESESESATATGDQRISSNSSMPAAEQALQQIQVLDGRIASLEQSQRQSLEVIEKLAEQNAQLVTTVSALRTGTQRLAWACMALGATCAGLVVYLIVFR